MGERRCLCCQRAFRGRLPAGARLYDDDELETLAELLGMPTGTRPHHDAFGVRPVGQVFPGDWRWPIRRQLDRYYVEAVGRIVRTEFDSPPPSSWFVEVDDANPSEPHVWAQIWLECVRSLGSVVVLERRWHPRRGGWLHLAWPAQSQVRRIDIERAWTARAILGLSSHGGRPHLEEDDQALWRELVLEARRLKRRYPKLAWSHIATRVGLSASTLKSYLRRAREPGELDYE